MHIEIDSLSFLLIGDGAVLAGVWDWRLLLRVVSQLEEVERVRNSALLVLLLEHLFLGSLHVFHVFVHRLLPLPMLHPLLLQRGRDLRWDLVS